jgi:hypothetical protein
VERPRVKSDKRRALKLVAVSAPPIATPPTLATNTGPLATAAWCLARNLFPPDRWRVECSLQADDGSRFEIEIYAEEWGFAFHHGGRVSWIRVTDIPFVHGRDEFDLLREVSGLRDLGKILRLVEHRCQITFSREAAAVRTDIAHAESTIREWLESL